MSIPEERERAREEFKATWCAILMRLLDWPQEQAERWANERQWVFESVWFLHDSPIHEMRSVLIPHDLQIQYSGADLCTLAVQVEEALAWNRQQGQLSEWVWHPDQITDYDWAAAKARLDVIFSTWRMA